MLDNKLKEMGRKTCPEESVNPENLPKTPKIGFAIGSFAFYRGELSHQRLPRVRAHEFKPLWSGYIQSQRHDLDISHSERELSLRYVLMGSVI